MSWIMFTRCTKPHRKTVSSHLPHPTRDGYCLCNRTIGEDKEDAAVGQRKCQTCVRRFREMRRGRWKVA